LLRRVAYLDGQTPTQEAPDTLTCEVSSAAGAVKVSFCGGLTLHRIEAPDIVASNSIAVASLRDLFGMKCATVTQRNEVRDYLDIHALLDATSIDLAEGMACARAIYGQQYSPMMTLQALSYFDDLSEPLAQPIKTALLRAVRSVSLEKIPVIVAAQKIGSDRTGG
jgi:hypothetical protein